MRILQFYKTSFPDTMGGIEQVINQIAVGITQLGGDADVLYLASQASPPSIAFNGYTVHRARMDFQIASTGFSLSVIRQFADLARRADVIHYHFPWPFMDVLHFACRIRKPTLVTYHSDIIRQKNLLRVYRPLQQRFLDSVDRIVATSPNYLETSPVLQRFSQKVSLIPIGLDRAAYPPPSETRMQFWRDRLGPRFFLFVGVIRYYKGLHVLLEAAKGLEYPIVIVGAGPVEQELKFQAERLGLHHAHFLGQLSDEDKTALLALSYAMVFPSHLRSEAFGVSLLEGAMHGKPMISCEIGTGTTFINVAGETGLVVPPNDPMALRAAMQQLWADPGRAAEMGRRAEQRFGEYFTAEQMSGSYMALYTELLERHHH